MRLTYYLFIVRNLYQKLHLFLNLPLFAYACLVFLTWFNAREVSPAVQLKVLAIPLILLAVLFLVYVFLLLYRIHIYRFSGELLLERVAYEWEILNDQGDLREFATFRFYNPTNRSIQFLESQHTAFLYKPPDPLAIAYKTTNPADGSRIYVTSAILEYEKTWQKGADERKVWQYNWKCEFRPSLASGEKLEALRFFEVGKTERDAFSGDNIVSYIPEHPTERADFKLMVPLEYEIVLEDIFITDEAGHFKSGSTKILKRPTFPNPNFFAWTIHFPLCRMRYGFRYRIRRRL